MLNDERSAWLEEMMERWEESLLRMCYAYLGDIALAEDALQETFLKAWRGYASFRGNASEKTWIMRIAINTCKDIRRGAWFRHINPIIALEQLPEAYQPFTIKDDAVTLAVMRLKPPLREVVLLHWYQGLTGTETAEALGISRSTVFHRLQKSQKLLQIELEDWYYEN